MLLIDTLNKILIHVHSSKQDKINKLASINHLVHSLSDCLPKASGLPKDFYTVAQVWLVECRQFTMEKEADCLASIYEPGELELRMCCLS